MRRGELVDITPDLESIAWEIAKERTQRNRDYGNENLVVDQSRRPIENELAGARAEIAVRLFLGLGISFEELCLPKPDGGVDIQIADYTIDVKYSHNPEGLLLFTKFTKFRALCAVLVTPTEYTSQLRIAGCVSRKKFCEEYRWYDAPFSKAPIPALEQKFLSPMQKLVEYLKQPRRKKYA